MIQGQEVMIESLGNGPGVLPFHLGTARVISHYHSFLNYINLDNVQTQIGLVTSKLSDIRPKLNNKTSFLFEPHIQYLNAKLVTISNELESFEHSRHRRGLVDGLGSIIKTISGNLDASDAIKYNNAIKLIQQNQYKLEFEINQHISLSKNWTSYNTKLLTNITKNQERITETLNQIIQTKGQDFVQHAHMAQYLTILSDNIDNLFQEFRKLEYTLAFIRASSTPHSIISVEEISYILDKLRVLYRKDEILDIELRYYYDIIKVGYFYVNNQIVLVFKIPIALPPIYHLFKLSAVPNKHNQIIIPVLPFIATSEKSSMYIEAECPKINSLYLCEVKSKFHTRDEPNCIQHLIAEQEIHSSCKMTHVILKTAAVEQLDEKHYITSFPNSTKVKISCGQETYKILKGSFLATVPVNCYIKTPDFTIANSHDHIRGYALKMIEIPNLDHSASTISMPVVLNSIELEKLHTISTKISLQAPVNLNRDTDYSVYHTTIPIYTILFGASALTIALWYRRRKLHQTQPIKTTENNEKTAYGIYTETQEIAHIEPGEVKVHHSNISSSLPTMISK